MNPYRIKLVNDKCTGRPGVLKQLDRETKEWQVVAVKPDSMNTFVFECEHGAINAAMSCIAHSIRAYVDGEIDFCLSMEDFGYFYADAVDPVLDKDVNRLGDAVNLINKVCR